MSPAETQVRGPWAALLAGVLGGALAGAIDGALALASSAAGARGGALLALGSGVGAVAGGILCALFLGVEAAVAARWPAAAQRGHSVGVAAAALASPIVIRDAVALFAGAQASRLPGHQALSALLVALGLAGGAWSARFVGRVLARARQRRSVALGGALAAAVLAAVGTWADRRVLPRLYPWFHETLAVFFLVGVILAVRFLLVGGPRAVTGTTSRRRLWTIGAVVAAVGLLAFGWTRLLRSDTVRFLTFERAPFVGALVRRVPGVFTDKPRSLAKGPTVPEHELPPLPEGPERPDADVVLITIDALRADHVGAYGYSRRTTPHIDALARRGVRFERAYAQAPHTSFSVASMLTGKYYPTIARLVPGDVHDPLTSLLRKYGWKTGALYPPAVFYVDSDKLKAYQDSNFDFEYVKVEFVDAQARLAQIAEFFETERPKKAFLWVHLFEPHEPYERWPEYDFGPSDVDRYDSEIAYADAAVGRLLRFIEQKRPGAIVILTADHGEEFDEHGGRYHGKTLFEEQIRVPLIIAVPDVAPRVIPGPVELIDLAPTILGLLDIPVPVRMRGTDLGPWLASPPAPNDRLPPAFAEVENKRMIVLGNEKLVCDLNFGFCQYFDLARDPREQRDLAAERPERVSELRGRLDLWLDDHGRFEPHLLRGQANPNGETIPKAIERGRLGHLGVIDDLFALVASASTEPLAVRREAARLIVTAMPVRRATRDRVRAGLEHPDPDIRLWMAVAAARLGEQDVAARLYPVVAVRAPQGRPDGATAGQDDPELRLQAALALAEVGDAAGLDVLVATLGACPSVPLCRLTVLALGKLRDPRAAPALIEHLGEVQNRHEMATALGDIGDPSALLPLAERLQNDEYVPVRAAAAHGLAKIALGHAELRGKVRGLLEGALGAEREGSVREAIEAARATIAGRKSPSRR